MKSKKVLTTILASSSFGVLITPLMNFSLVGCSRATKPVIKNTYTVHFDSEGGSTIADQKVTDGNLLTKPSDPSRSLHKFIWWYTDPDCTDGTEFHFNKPVTSDLTLYAKWDWYIVDVTAVQVDSPGQTIYSNMQYQLTATVMPRKASCKTVTWSSSDESVATIDAATGLLTTLAPGQTIIIAASDYDSTIYGTYNLKVEQYVPVTEIRIDANRAVMKGSSIRLNPVVYPLNASNKALTYSIDNPKIAIVDQSGNVQGLALGKTTIHIKSVSNPNVVASCALDVVSTAIPVSSVKFDQNSMELPKHESKLIIPTITPTNATDHSLIWWSDNKDIADVDENGYVTGNGNGTTTIHAQSVSNPEKSDYCVVWVYTDVTDVVLPEVLSVDVNKPAKLTAKVLPEDVSDNSVTWKSSDESVATINESGLIQPHSVGVTTITATSVFNPTKSAKCLVGIYPIFLENAVDIIGTKKFDFSINQKLWSGKIEYSLDTNNWYEWNGKPIKNIQTLYLRGKGNTRLSKSETECGTFKFSGSKDLRIILDGNVNCLLDYENPSKVQLDDFAFCNLFNNCDNIVSAPALPCLELSYACYLNMFKDCDNLVYLPELPATTLANYCYYGMFEGCDSLITMPDLPAETLTSFCYARMFSDCTSLINLKKLPATTLAIGCYQQMFKQCWNLVEAPYDMLSSALYFESFCYREMFYSCTSLRTPPFVPTVQFSSENISVYNSMFFGCFKLYIYSTGTSKNLKDYKYFFTAPSVTTNMCENMFISTGSWHGIVMPNTKFYFFN